MTTTAIEAGAVLAELFTPEGIEDPYPRYARLHELGRVFPTPLGFTFVPGYEDCSALLHNPRAARDADGMLHARGFADWRDRPSLRAMYSSLLFLNPPDHTRLRRLVTRAFTPARVAALRPAVTRLADGLLDDLAERAAGGPVELMGALAFPFPVAVIGELLGIPAPDRSQFQTLVRDFSLVLELAVTPEQVARADDAALRIQSYLRDLVAERRARPTGDLTSELVAAGDRDDRLDEQELLVMLGLLLAAGFETTTNLIGNGVMALLRHPDELARWRADPGLTPSAVEELLRYDASVQVTGRSLIAPLTVGGAELEPGRLVIALLGAANHDPVRFDDPGRFRLDRPGNRPLTFGGGIHYCLGAQLARLEAAALFPALLGRFAAIEQAGPPGRRPSLALRGYLELPLALTPVA